MLLACGPHASSSTASQEFSTDHFDKPIVGYSNFVGVPILSRLLLFSVLALRHFCYSESIVAVLRGIWRGQNAGGKFCNLR